MLSSAINASDVAAIALLLSDETFAHRYMPSTMGPESVGSRNKAEILAVFKGTFDKVMDHMGGGGQIDIREMVQGQDRIVILISSVLEYQDSLYIVKEFKGWYEQSTTAKENDVTV
ncbi:hypothetical protein C8Q76DRAFT_788691 [Earliella scabrosa]|nr:hypothetical protein C8Q76DRAFT_788691 [Earliella scabrosa]